MAAEATERGLRLLGVKAVGVTTFVDGGASAAGAAVGQMAVASGTSLIASADQANRTTCGR